MSNLDVATHLIRTELSDSDIVPDEMQNRLMTWRDVFKAGQFDIGDCAVELIEGKAKEGVDVPHWRIFKAIGRYCGKKPRTVRYYYETAIFYSPDLRDEYEVLPFSHFVFARTMGVAWQSVLDYSAEHPGISVDGLIAHFLGGDENDVDLDDYRHPGDGETIPQADIPQDKICETSQNNDRLDTHITLSDLDDMIAEMQALSDKCAKLRTIREMPEMLSIEIAEAFAVLKEKLPKLAKYMVE
jgi:hypothetical protein